MSKVDFRQYIESFIDFPQKGVVYWDFTPLLANPHALRSAVNEIQGHFSHKVITKIVAVEAKGFTLGAALAYAMEKPLVLVRKPDLVPGEIDSERFVKEYGFGEYQMKKGQLLQSDLVLIVYDIMAGPGATAATINLVTRCGAQVAGCAFVIELEYLSGRENLPNCDIFSLVKINYIPSHC